MFDFPNPFAPKSHTDRLRIANMLLGQIGQSPGLGGGIGDAFRGAASGLARQGIQMGNSFGTPQPWPPQPEPVQQFQQAQTMQQGMQPANSVGAGLGNLATGFAAGQMKSKSLDGMTPDQRKIYQPFGPSPFAKLFSLGK